MTSKWRAALVCAGVAAALGVIVTYDVLARRRPPVSAVTNDDIHWFNDSLALEPRAVGQAALDELAAGRNATQRLVEALPNHKRFAAAHVLLTKLHGVAPPGFTSDPALAKTYNGLVVTRDPEGRAVIPNTQRWRIRAYWQLRLEALSDA